jgi:putative peptidoglycan lipid II flippase
MIVGIAILVAFGGTTDGGFALANTASAAITMVAVGLAMGVVYLGVLRLLRTPELADAIAPIASRFRRRSEHPQDTE